MAAARVNPLDMRANYVLGLLQAATEHNSVAAEKDFNECVRRLKAKDTLSNDDRANLIGSLNNLGITGIRQKKYAAALRHWKEATQVAVPPFEVIQNVGRLVHLAEVEPKLAIPADTKKSAGNLFAGIAASAMNKRSYSPHIGWMYIWLFETKDKKKTDDPRASEPPPQAGNQPAAEPIVVGFGSGFVIQQGFIVTNNHVAGDADGLRIFTRRNQAVSYPAQAVAFSPAEDLALLECKELQAAPVPFCLDPPKLASDVLVLGYPRPDVIGTQLKATKGTISGLPDPNVDNHLVYDAQTNPGNSGGPTCDQYGPASPCTVPATAWRPSLPVASPRRWPCRS